MALPHIAALQAAGFAMQVDLLPLATNAQLTAAIAPLATTVQLAAAIAPLATTVQLAAAIAPLATNVQLVAAIAPLATNVQLAAAIAPLATTVQLANTNAQLVAMQANINAQFAALQAQLALIGIPVIAAAAAAAVQAIVSARVANNHSRSGVAYAVVPRADGTAPLNWPAGFDRATLRTGPIAVITALLNDYGLIAPAAAFDRRNLLALHIGTADL
jgi:hypothetical protein